MSDMKAAMGQAITPKALAFQRNSKWAVKPPGGNYLTQLDPQTEGEFQDWVKSNKVPFDPAPDADYDMRGFYQAQKAGDPEASTGVNQNDGQLHFTDKFKTPYHQSFSRESMWATKDAPEWNDKDQLVDRQGRVIFDERKQPRDPLPPENNP